MSKYKKIWNYAQNWMKYFEKFQIKLMTWFWEWFSTHDIKSKSNQYYVETCFTQMIIIKYQKAYHDTWYDFMIVFSIRSCESLCWIFSCKKFKTIQNENNVEIDIQRQHEIQSKIQKKAWTKRYKISLFLFNFHKQTIVDLIFSKHHNRTLFVLA